MNWTKFSERLPEEGVYQAHVLWPNKAQQIFSRPPSGWDMFHKSEAMWHPITYPELPREETQHDKDSALCEKLWLEKGTGHSQPEFRCGFFEALRYERAEVTKELAEVISVESASGAMGHQILARLRRRVGLDK